MAVMAIFIIGADILLLWSLEPIIRFAMKNSKFNILLLFRLKNTILFLMGIVFLSISCKGQEKNFKVETVFEENTPETYSIVGANQTSNYLKLLRNKKVGVVANQTSVIFKPQSIIFKQDYYDSETKTYKQKQVHQWSFSKHTHLIDSLLSHNINITKVFVPEHGFRGTADAGEIIKDGKDIKTGLPIISLYGNNKKPTAAQMQDMDILIFDVQDVGVRFYTYISTLHYVMEACAEAGITLLILDRPNPNIHYIDGPILEPQYKSFVGIHPVPVVHGMTIGEYAKMINGEKWLENEIQCPLKIITVEHYNRSMSYSLPIKPSPNLPNDQAINLYPSLCFFEGTPLSEGRGTEMQFQVFGSPDLPKTQYSFTFTPGSNEGAKNPKFNGQLCYGKDLRTEERLNNLNLEWLIEAYIASGKKNNFFTPFFTSLSGTKKLQEQIEGGYTYRDIRATWLKDLKKYDTMRKPYLLYE
ncbi:MAG: DUF1343 domain-containing protein [Bacteroidetes bacterium HGW-Bacteroidetes-2]|nr:MAG: DUF1343 domain-containing protein [Bacteroidetes bacterium HGW-Bacteroidetes-2]